jgi:excisionase family DNA binding protein
MPGVKALCIDRAMCNAHDMPNTDSLIGSAEACTILGVDRSTLSRWVQLGKITPAMRLPGPKGVMLFNRDDVERLRTEYTAATA